MPGINPHSGAYRVKFDVARAGPRVISSLSDTGFAPPFPAAAGAPVEAVGVLHVAAPQGLHQPGWGAGFLQRAQKMNFVGPEDVSVNGAAASASHLVRPIEIPVVVLIGEKARLAVDAAMDAMQRAVGEKDSGAAVHGQWFRKPNVSDPFGL